MDGAGKRFAVLAAAAIKAANALALVSRFNRQMWSDIAPILAHLPDNKKEEATVILQDSARAASESIDMPTDISSIGFRQMVGAVSLRRQGWLKATSFRPEVQVKIVDMPFDGENLFGKHIDEALKGMKDYTDTAKALGSLQQSNFQSYHGRGSRGRFNKRSSFQSGRYQPYQQGYHQYNYNQHFRSSNAPYQQQSTKKPAARGKAQGSNRRQ